MFCSVIIPSVAIHYINSDATPDTHFLACFWAERSNRPCGMSSNGVSRPRQPIYNARSSAGPNPRWVLHMSRVLVVEDDRDIADLITRYLQKAGHTTEHIPSGSAALARVREAAPDLIVLDVMLPGMDGLMICQALRGDPSTAAI